MDLKTRRRTRRLKAGGGVLEQTPNARAYARQGGTQKSAREPPQRLTAR